jgi:predicted ATPase/DNA-binding winged helix-turn-helix (wHTH) protein
MSKSEEKQFTVYRFGRFEVNRKEQILRRDGEIVPLTPKIFETLLLLVENNNRMLSKDEIMETVWADSFVEETNLTSNISRLRKILHAGGEQFIETFPKRGYRFFGAVEAVAPETEIVLTRRVRTAIRQVVEETDEAETAENIKLKHLLATVPNNLSAETPLVGREKEIGEIETLLGKSRLVTLTGIGGTGKTRLAREVARRMLEEFTDGVFFVALADVQNPEFVLSAIVQPFGVKETGNQTLIETLKNFLKDKHLLLVTDNFEQVIAAAPVLNEILKAAPRVKILATSRILLKLSAEREFVVPPLDFPSDFGESTLETLAECEAVKLFVERAQAAKSNFVFNDENAAIVAEICLRLEGLPLAIELAAARIKILSPQQILERLESRLKLLTGGARDLPARQQTMRGAIEWSYDLLGEAEKILFRRIAVFAGGFTVEAVETVCGNNEVQSPKSKVKSPKTKDKKSTIEIDMLNCLTTLVENSLVFQTDAGRGEARFRLLEVVREYALEQLEASGESDLLKKSHSAFFLKLAQDAEPQITSKEDAKWLRLIGEELNNLRAAFSWLIDNDTATAINLAGALRETWALRNQLSEGRKWFETALERAGDAPAAARFKLLNGLGQVTKFEGDYAASEKASREGLSAGREANDLRQIAIASRGLAAAVKGQGNFSAARKYYEEALAISREIGEKFGIAVSLNALGDLARIEGDFKAARPFFEESLAICRELGNKQGISCTLNNLGAVAFALDDYVAARLHFAEGLTTTQELGDKFTLSYSLDGFAALAVKSGDAEQAMQLAGAAEHLRESLGFDTEPAERRFREAYLAELSFAADQKSLTEAREQGRRLKIQKAVELALTIGKRN